MDNKRYFGGFSSWKGMCGQFSVGGFDYEEKQYEKIPLPSGFPDDAQVLFAAYGTEEAYSGSAIVVYKVADGTLRVVEGSHCSCYGLEGQWEPTKTTSAALSMMELGYEYDQESKDAFRSLWPKKEEI